MGKNSKSRFSDRVGDYIKYRPHYPQDLVKQLEEKIKLTPDKIVADIGSGTGISSVQFVENGNRVFGVEPNKEMREAQEQLLKAYSNFTSLNGSAEHTGLKDQSIEVIFCAQAFHWFDLAKTKVEFERIRSDTGNIVLAWNERINDEGFTKEYERILLENLPEYREVDHKNIDETKIATFFAPKKMHRISLANEQYFNLEGLKGRLRSSSYVPLEGPLHEKIFNEISGCFDEFQKDGRIRFPYTTNIYWC